MSNKNETIAAPKTRTTYFSEAAQLTEAKDGGYEVTLIKPGWSANGRYYSKESLGRAVSQFEGVKAYLDHPSASDEKNRPERSVKDIAGSYKNVRQAEDGRLVASFRPVGVNGDFIKPLIEETLSGNPELIGLSINALGKTSQGEAEGRKGIIVEDIVRGNSTDIVTTPAAGGRFERLTASDDGFTRDLLDALDYEEWREAKPDFIVRLREELKTQRQDEALKESRAASSTLREQLTEKEKRIGELEEAGRAKDAAVSDLRANLARRDTQAYADRLIAEAKFPPAWTSAFKPQLLGVADTGLWPSLVETERAKMRLIRPIVEVRLGGTVPLAPSTTNPVAEAFGVAVVPLDGESPAEYGARKARLTHRS